MDNTTFNSFIRSIAHSQSATTDFVNTANSQGKLAQMFNDEYVANTFAENEESMRALIYSENGFPAMLDSEVAMTAVANSDIAMDVIEEGIVNTASSEMPLKTTKEYLTSLQDEMAKITEGGASLDKIQKAILSTETAIESINRVNSKSDVLAENLVGKNTFYKVLGWIGASETALGNLSSAIVGKQVIIPHGVYGDIVFDICRIDTDGIALVSKYCITSRQWHTSNSNAYASSTIRSWLNNDFLNGFAEDVQKYIKAKNIPCSGGGTVTDKIWLPSMIEMGISYRDPRPQDEGRSFSYIDKASKYSNMCVDGAANPTYIWTRSPYYSNATHQSGAYTFGASGQYFSVSTGTNGVCIGLYL